MGDCIVFSQAEVKQDNLDLLQLCHRLEWSLRSDEPNVRLLRIFFRVYCHIVIDMLAHKN